MGLVVMDVFNVKVIDAETGKELFEIDSALETKISIDGYGDVCSLAVKDCFLNVNVFDDAMGGIYEGKKLVLNLLSKTRDSETGLDGKLELIAYKAELGTVSLNSNASRLMTSNINFYIYKRDEDGNKAFFIFSKMDKEHGE